MRSRSVHGLSALFFVCLLPLSRAICYYPNGDASPQDLPCRDGTDHSTCCGPGYACLSNNICMATGLERQIPNAAKYYRGSCTDKTWRSSQCPNFCVNAAHDDTLEGGMGMAKCPGIEDMYYCMDGFPFDCATGDNVLSFSGDPGSPTALTTIGFGVPTSTSPASPLLPFTTSSSVSSLSSAISTSTGPSPSANSEGPSYTTSSSAFISTLPTQTSNTSGPTSSEASSVPEGQTTQPPNGPSATLIAGVAAGVSIGVIGLAAAAFAGYRRFIVRGEKSTTRRLPPQEVSSGRSASMNWDAGDKQRYDTVHVAYPTQTMVYELPVERLRIPELATGGR